MQCSQNSCNCLIDNALQGPLSQNLMKAQLTDTNVAEHCDSFNDSRRT